MIAERQAPESPRFIHDARDYAIDCCVFCVIPTAIVLIALTPFLLSAWGCKVLYDRITLA